MLSKTVNFLLLTISTTCTLYAAPDISNLTNCIQEVRQAERTPPTILTFDIYKKNYQKLIADLKAVADDLPLVYQQAASTPLIEFLESLGEFQYLSIFDNAPQDQQTALYQEIIPDAVLAILFQQHDYKQQVYAFQEIVSDLYDSFLSDAARTGKQSGTPIQPLTYGVIPPLVKFGNPENGPYTWPVDATNQILGMQCAVVSLPPAQLKGGLIAWTCLGHETGGHDVTHADKGLLQELGQKVYQAVLKKFQSRNLAAYWESCIDETSADVFGYLNMGPSAAIGLIGYFRALGNGKLRNVGSQDDPHPIDLLRGYIAAAVVKRLHFKDAAVWSQTITKETHKDDRQLYLTDSYGLYHRFPVSFDNALASADVVAETILNSKLSTLEGHSIQEIQDWTDADQDIVNTLVSALKTKNKLPTNLAGPGFYAAHVVAAATQTALERGANIPVLFKEMQEFLAIMHSNNPTWSSQPTVEALTLLEKVQGVEYSNESKQHHVFSKLAPEDPSILEAELFAG